MDLQNLWVIIVHHSFLSSAKKFGEGKYFIDIFLSSKHHEKLKKLKWKTLLQTEACNIVQG